MYVKCLKCNNVIKSLSRRDLVSCSCGRTSVDGGNELPRVKGSEWEVVKEVGTWKH